MVPQQKDDITLSILSSIESLKQQNSKQADQIINYKQLIQELLSFTSEQRICPNNHPLRYLHNPKSFLSSLYICNKCNSRCNTNSTLRWNCSLCNYDLCVKCGGYRNNLCPYMHTINGRRNVDMEKIKRLCDVCLKHIKGIYFTCGCGFDMCQDCKTKGGESGSILKEEKKEQER